MKIKLAFCALALIFAAIDGAQAQTAQPAPGEVHQRFQNQQERIDAANSKFERRRYSICTAAYRAQIVSS